MKTLRNSLNSSLKKEVIVLSVVKGRAICQVGTLDKITNSALRLSCPVRNEDGDFVNKMVHVRKNKIQKISGYQKVLTLA